MRSALNNNPKVQGGVVVVLLLLGAFMFMRMSGGGEETSEADAIAELNAASAAATGVAPSGGTSAGTAATAATGAPPATAVTGAPAATAAAPAAGGIPAVPATATGSVPPEALVPGPGLPAEVAQAYARGNVIVLLLVKQGSTDDELVQRSVARISRPGVAVFVAPAGRVARYSRITQGVGVTRVPALIVVRPRSAAGAAPQATVSYGFRELSSVLQAVDDALYRGSDNLPYHPG